MVAVGVVAVLEIGHEGIDDDEGDIEPGDDLIEEGNVGGNGEGDAMLAAIGEGEEAGNLAGIAAGGLDAGADGVAGVVFGGEDEDGPGFAGLSTREGLATGDAGGELAEKGALAEAGITIEEGDLAGSEAARGEPLDRFGGDAAEGVDVGDGIAPGLAGWRVCLVWGGWSMVRVPPWRAGDEEILEQVFVSGEGILPDVRPG